MKNKIVFILFSMLFLMKSSAQCAMCRAVLETEEGQTAAEGINNGIMYLMAIPYILVAALGYFIYLRFYKLKK
ncbi:hypothetical protein CLV33_11147 [Jejuia pallidilutea]|uniref:Uncharacterized protein n=2 Tax=Jejuia pallidilutea TaxID=504487 RepID=A0A362X8X4_9FLAO|nr:hypothetical protein [Jejuia pallidilutea]PQV45997.1 hypothetical protein CLV33_11147 [Jejuia pallidilutea]